MTEDNKTLSDLFTKEELEEYNKTEYPFNLSILHTALKLKLEEDPEYEVWAPLIYYRSAAYMKKSKGQLLLKPYKVFISNKGRVLSLRRDKPKFLTLALGGQYPTINFTLDDNVTNVVFLHRAIACTFISVKEELGYMHPKDLTVNHSDGDKGNYQFNNLEWCTQKQNIQHAFETGLADNKRFQAEINFKPVKGKVLVGRFKGFEFILDNLSECIKNCFTPRYIKECYLGKARHHLNCSWALATKEEIEKIPRLTNPEIKTSILTENPPPPRTIKSSIEVTKIKTGERFIVTGGLKELILLGFSASGVSKVLTARSTQHKGCTFKRV